MKWPLDVQLFYMFNIQFSRMGACRAVGDQVTPHLTRPPPAKEVGERRVLFVLLLCWVVYLMAWAVRSARR